MKGHLHIPGYITDIFKGQIFYALYPCFLFILSKTLLQSPFKILYKTELPQKAGYEPSITGTKQ